MSDDEAVVEAQAKSSRANERAAKKARREARAQVAESVFEAVAGGCSIELIAKRRKVSARTVRREMDQALSRRRLDAPERYAHLQVAQLMKALSVADGALDEGDLKAVPAMLKVVAALDRYHGGAVAAAQLLDARPLSQLPAPPLRLAAFRHARPESDARDHISQDDCDLVTVSGAQASEKVELAPGSSFQRPRPEGDAEHRVSKSLTRVHRGNAPGGDAVSAGVRPSRRPLRGLLRTRFGGSARGLPGDSFRRPSA